MRKYWIVASAALLTVLLLIVGRSCRKQEEKVLRADSKDLKHTIITSHLEAKIVPGKNLIYCSTFQLAWNELRDKIHKEDIRLEDEPPMVKILNKKLTTKADLSDDCYLAMAGFGKNDIVNKINRALRSKFGSEAPTVAAQLDPFDILAYAFLLKDLEFKTPFESLRNRVNFRSESGDAKVKAFGIRDFISGNRKHRKLREQVSVLDYDQQSGEFVIGLHSKSPKDEIILAKVKPRQTLIETIQSVANTVKEAPPQSLQDYDTLQIPKLNFDIYHKYSELLGKFLLNEGFDGYYFREAWQKIRFRLSERGAVLRSEAELEEETAEVPRSFVLDRPFLLYLKEKTGKYPYLAIWVDNPEILLKH